MAAYAALVSLKHIIDNLQHHPHPPISLHKNNLHLLTSKISFLQEFLEGYDPYLSYATQPNPLDRRIADAAYAAEDVIESHIVDRITNDGEKMSSDAFYGALEKVIEEMALIEKEAMQVKEIITQLHIKSTPPNSSRSSSIVEKSSMVGADDVLLAMKDKLTDDRLLGLRVIPVVGMGGSGKTTLARTIYQDRLIKERFDICVWATVSQEYSIKEILKEILRQLNQNIGQNLSEEALGEKLYKHLIGRKYLIILDDMWSIESWDVVKWFLPDKKNGSRIVVTTRLSNLASKLPKYDSILMKFLDMNDSWELLSKIVFGGKLGCPLELEEIGKKIGKSCKGLPLSIVVVGGLLAKSPHTREFWEYIEKNLNSIVNLEDDERCFKILHMSYKQLPVYLKPCFLYMGVFLEDEVIHISRLVKIWVAEGFLKPVSGKPLEEVGEAYLKDLIGRNLILIHELGSTGNIKQCKIHDLLRDVCLREVEKERFYRVVARPTTSRGIKDSTQRGIVVHSTTSKNEAINALASMSLTRSLMWDLDQPLPLLNSRLLRVLDSRRFQSTSKTEFLENVHQLVNLRFLTLSSPPESEFPCSIWRFWNLQTIIVNGFSEITAPSDIWYMPHIRHLQFFEGLHLPNPLINRDDIVLKNLQTLGRIMNFNCSKEMVKRIPNVKKLQIFYDEGLDENMYCLNNLDCLAKLESFTCDIQGTGPTYRLSLMNFPHSLKKMTISIERSQCWHEILDKIGSLPLLEKLTLFSGSFKGRWETTEGQFRSLKFLVLYECTSLEHWTTESSHFPCLEHLFLHQVDEMKEIPLDFAEISTLKVIHMRFCSSLVVVSAKRILEEQEELYGETNLQIKVTLFSYNKALMSMASPKFRVTCLQN